MSKTRKWRICMLLPPLDGHQPEAAWALSGIGTILWNCTLFIKMTQFLKPWVTRGHFVVSDQKIDGPISGLFPRGGKELAPLSGFEWANGDKNRVVCWHLSWNSIRMYGFVSVLHGACLWNTQKICMNLPPPNKMKALYLKPKPPLIPATVFSVPTYAVRLYI